MLQDKKYLYNSITERKTSGQNSITQNFLKTIIVSDQKKQQFQTYFDRIIQNQKYKKQQLLQLDQRPLTTNKYFQMKNRKHLNQIMKIQPVKQQNFNEQKQIQNSLNKKQYKEQKFEKNFLQNLTPINLNQQKEQIEQKKPNIKIKIQKVYTKKHYLDVFDPWENNDYSSFFQQ